jgi:catalase (peroxidase I)
MLDKVFRKVFRKFSKIFWKFSENILKLLQKYVGGVLRKADEEWQKIMPMKFEKLREQHLNFNPM